MANTVFLILLICALCLVVIAILYISKIVNSYNLRKRLNFLESENVRLRILVQELRKNLVFADHDSLTGVFNRRYFFRRLEESLDLVKRDAITSALLYIDLDNFKDINDTYGHSEGDHFLTEIAQLWQHNIRHSDCLGRIGGDEFALLLHNVDLEKALLVGEKLRNLLEAHTFISGKNSIAITASIGIYILGKDCFGPEKALERADKACYAAKEAGRNKINYYKAVA